MLFRSVQLFATPWTVAYQAPPSMGFSRQEYWSGVPLSSPMGSSSLLCTGFSSWWLLLLQNIGSRHEGSVAVVRGVGLLHGMWNLLEPGIKFMSLSLAGKLLPTVPPGKSCYCGAARCYFQIHIRFISITLEGS